MDARWHTDNGRRGFSAAVRQAALRRDVYRCSGAALGTRSNFIIAADRIRRCLIATTSSGIASFGSLILIVEKSRPSCGRYST
jgi:hypothetical protein